MADQNGRQKSLVEIAQELKGRIGEPVIVINAQQPGQNIALLLLQDVTLLRVGDPNRVALWPEGAIFRLEGAELSPSSALVANYFPGSRLIVGRDEIAGYLGQRNINADCVPYMRGTNGRKA